MKYLICKVCKNTWYVEAKDLDRLRHCPFCGEPLRKKQEITTLDTLEKVIYRAVQGLGPRAFDQPGSLRGYMGDIAPAFSKELKILSHSLQGDYFVLVRQAFTGELSQAETVLNRLKLRLMEEEGLSETWAQRTCQSYLGAVAYCHGVGLEERWQATIGDFTVPRSQQPAAQPQPQPRPAPTKPTTGAAQPPPRPAAQPQTRSQPAQTAAPTQSGTQRPLFSARTSAPKAIHQANAQYRCSTCGSEVVAPEPDGSCPACKTKGLFKIQTKPASKPAQPAPQPNGSKPLFTPRQPAPAEPKARYRCTICGRAIDQLPANQRCPKCGTATLFATKF